MVMYENSGYTFDNKVKPIEIRNKKIITLALDTKDLLTTFSQLLNVIEPVHGVPLYSRELSHSNISLLAHQ